MLAIVFWKLESNRIQATDLSDGKEADSQASKEENLKCPQNHKGSRTNAASDLHLWSRWPEIKVSCSSSFVPELLRETISSLPRAGELISGWCEVTFLDWGLPVGVGVRNVLLDLAADPCFLLWTYLFTWVPVDRN